MAAIEFIGNLRRADIRPGDRFVLTVEAILSEQQKTAITAVWKDFAGDTVKLLIIDKSLRLDHYTLPSD